AAWLIKPNRSTGPILRCAFHQYILGSRARLLRWLGRRSNRGFIRRPRFHRGFRPTHGTPQIVGPRPSSRPCDRIGLVFLWSYTRQPPDSGLRFGLLIALHALITVSCRLDHG